MIEKIHIIIGGCLVAACAPPRPTPYVASTCPFPAGAHGYPVAAHDLAGKLDTATLSRIARAVARNLKTSDEHDDKRDTAVPDDIAVLVAARLRNQPLSRGGWNPSASDTATVLIAYHAGGPAPVIRPARADSKSDDFMRRVVRAANDARDVAEQRKIRSDTLPLQLPLADGDSSVVLVRFGAEPGMADGTTRFAVQQRDVFPLFSDRVPEYPSLLRPVGEEGKVLLSFVVGPDSAADMTTVRVVRSSHPAFTKSVLEFLPHGRYAPLELDCHLVASLVQQPFEFHIRGPVNP